MPSKDHPVLLKYWIWLTVAVGALSLPGLLGIGPILHLQPSPVRDYSLPAVTLVLLLAPLFPKINILGLAVEMGTPLLSLMKIGPLALTTDVSERPQPQDTPAPPDHVGDAQPNISPFAERRPLPEALYWVGNDLASIRFQLLLKGVDPVEHAALLHWQTRQANLHLQTIMDVIRVHLGASASRIAAILGEELHTIHLEFAEWSYSDRLGHATNLLTLQKQLPEVLEAVRGSMARSKK